MELPRTMHGQLYLLAYCRKCRRFEYGSDDPWAIRWRFGFALESAMLADLYLAGYLDDQEGRARRVSYSSHGDQVLDATVNKAPGRLWSEVITVEGREARNVVREQLETEGWISGKERRTFGFLPRSRQAVHDVDMVEMLAARVTEALVNALADRPADPRSLAVGLIAVEAHLPVVDMFNANTDANTKRRNLLREMMLGAIEPVRGFHQAIQDQYVERGFGAPSRCVGGSSAGYSG